MESFLSELLHLWTKDLGHESETSTLALSMTPGRVSNRVGHDTRSLTSITTTEDGGAKRIAVTSQINNMIIHNDVKSRVYKAAQRLGGKINGRIVRVEIALRRVKKVIWIPGWRLDALVKHLTRHG